MALYKIEKDAGGVPTGETTLVAGATTFADSPIGAILPYGGATAPSGWFLCDGTAVSRTTYSELFAVIGTAFGSGDGSTTFNLPDLREATTKGVGLSGKASNHYDSNGLALGEFINDRMQTHTHVIGCGDVKDGYTRPFIGGGNVATNFTSNSNNGRSGATTEVKAVGVNYIIKAKMVGVPADFMSAVDEAVEEAMADTGWVTVNSYVKARRIGKMVSLELTFTKSAISAANWTKVADLETRFYPSKQAIGCAYTYVTGSEIQFDNYYINSATGAVSLLGNTDLVATVTYFAD